MPNLDIEAVAERAASKAIDGFFEKLGVDVGDTKAIIAMQKDFAHLRAWRESTDLVKKRGLTAAATIVVTGLLGIIYAFFTHRL